MDQPLIIDSTWIHNHPEGCQNNTGKVMSIRRYKKEEKETIQAEWGGSLRCITSDGRNVNIADELNRIEKEKNGTEENNVC